MKNTYIQLRKLEISKLTWTPLVPRSKVANFYFLINLKMNQMEDIEGKELHGYKIIKPIGEGKFSIVYKATRISNG